MNPETEIPISPTLSLSTQESNSSEVGQNTMQALPSTNIDSSANINSENALANALLSEEHAASLLLASTSASASPSNSASASAAGLRAQQDIDTSSRQQDTQISPKPAKKPAKCVHGKTAAFCVPCRGSHICVHLKRRSRCVPCKGSQICVHLKVKAQCVECLGSQICSHRRQRAKCVDCQGSQVCKHGRQRYFCKECKPNSPTSPNTSPNAPSSSIASSISNASPQSSPINSNHKSATQSIRQTYNHPYQRYHPDQIRVLPRPSSTTYRNEVRHNQQHIPSPGESVVPCCRHGKAPSMCLKCLCGV